MLSTLKSYLWGAVASLIALLSAALWWTAKSRNRATQAAREAEQNAQGERDAREHVQQTTEKTNEVEDAIRRTSADERRERLRDEYAQGSGD